MLDRPFWIFWGFSMAVFGLIVVRDWTTAAQYVVLAGGSTAYLIRDELRERREYRTSRGCAQ